MPSRARGAEWSWGDAACLRQGRFGEGARGFFPLGVFGASGIFLHASRPVPRAGLTGADDGFLPHPGCFRFRRGHGGLRPHPLKGLVP